MIKSDANKTRLLYPLVLLTVFITSTLTSFGQSNRANHWVFPDHNHWDFTTGNPVASYDTLPGFQGSSSISDTNGNLILYSNGMQIRGANGALIMNGINLLGSNEATQSSLILPSPSPLNPTRYFLFTVDLVANGNGVNFYEIEMSLNGGLGMVLPPTPLLDSAVEKITAVKHANDKDYWVVIHKLNSNEFHSYLLGQSGMSATPVISAVGISHNIAPLSGEATGHMKISPDGTKLAAATNGTGTVQLFDFDNATGQVSNPVTIFQEPLRFPYAVEFSADSKKLFFSEYLSSFSDTAKIHQFDLDHSSPECIIYSEQIFDHNDAFKSITSLQLGPDKKIYVGYYEAFAYDSNGTINQPHLLGEVNLNFVKSQAPLANPSGSSKGGLPAFPTSYLSDGIFVEQGTNCDGIATSFWPEDTLGIDSVNWNFGDPISGSNTSTNINATHLFSGVNDTFTVTLTRYKNGVATTYERDVVIWDTAINLLGNDTTVCAGQQVTLDATYYDACVEWNTGSSIDQITTTQEGWYWVDVSHHACLFRDSIYVTEVSSPPVVDLGADTSVCTSVNFVLDPDLQNAFYTWQDGSHDTTFSVTATGSYALTATNACGSDADTMTVTLNQAAQPVLNFPEDTTLCDTIPFEVDVTFLGAIYNWHDGNSNPIRLIETPGSYAVTVANACDTVSDTMNVAFNEPIENNLPDREVFCGLGDTVYINGFNNQTTTIWSNGLSQDTGIFTSPGLYFIEGSNACGFIEDSIEVLTWDANYQLFIGKDTVVCSDTNSVLIGDLLQDFPFAYNWSNGAKTALTFVNPGLHSLTASNRCAAVQSSILIETATEVTTQPLEEYIICPGESIDLGLSVNPVRSVSWSHGPSTDTVTFDAAGSYTATITDTNGCIFEETIVFSDSCPGMVSVGNVFTPNGDAVNDEFCVKLKNILEYELIIYNRWGTEVFETSDNEQPCWDGANNTGPMNPGPYFYVLETLDAQGKATSYRGSFTLLR